MTVNPMGNRFCESCGSQLQLACSKCGHDVQLFARFCGTCGSALQAGGTGTAAGHDAAPPKWGELKQATVLFADIVGSTELVSHMIELARSLWQDDLSSQFVLSASLPRLADYSVASGVFNVQLGFSEMLWKRFVSDTLDELHRASTIGFAVNFVSPPRPDITEPLQGLYRTRPEPWIAHCRHQFDADVTLIENYGLREFTLLVRKPEV